MAKKKIRRFIPFIPVFMVIVVIFLLSSMYSCFPIICNDIDEPLPWYGYGSQANDVILSPDGEVIIIGCVVSSVDYVDHYVNGSENVDKRVFSVKLKQDGEKLSHKLFEETSYTGYDIDFTSDGGYIVAGMNPDIVDFNDYDIQKGDPYLTKLDSNFNKEWEKVYDSGYYGGIFNSVVQKDDGGYIAVGKRENALYFMETDTNGNIVSESDDYYNFVEGEAHTIKKTTDGGYIIGGNTMGRGYILKMSSVFTSQWEYNFVNFGNINSVIEDASGNYVISGKSMTEDSNYYYFYTAKLDPSGNLIWEHFNDEYGKANDIVQTHDNGYFAVGMIDYYIAGIKYKPDGTIAWEYRDFDDNHHYGFAKAVLQNDEGNYVIVGQYNGKFLAFMIDESLNELWRYIYNWQGIDNYKQ